MWGMRNHENKSQNSSDRRNTWLWRGLITVAIFNGLISVKGIHSIIWLRKGHRCPYSTLLPLQGEIQRLMINHFSRNPLLACRNTNRHIPCQIWWRVLRTHMLIVPMKTLSVRRSIRIKNWPTSCPLQPKHSPTKTIFRCQKGVWTISTRFNSGR